MSTMLSEVIYGVQTLVCFNGGLKSALRVHSLLNYALC